MMNFTTIFDSYYLDKALVLYESLVKKAEDNFHIYIFCFDDKAREILLDKNMKNATILHHSDLEKEYPELTKLKKERSKAEYCWTCTPASIEYVLNHFRVDSCTYIDADLYFFSSPQILFDEIESAKADVVITPHRFTNSPRDRRLCNRSGKYCVEFNYFNQSKNARECLSWWREQCFEWCYHLYEPDRMGDQKYLMKFESLFQGVHILEHLGGGVAPWNLGQYDFISHKKSKNDNSENPLSREIVLAEKKTGKEFPLVFYHFQNLRYISETKANISSGTKSKRTKEAIYYPYLRAIETIRKELKDMYGISFSVKKIYSSNKFIGFLQGTILRFKVKSWSDIVDLTKL